MTVKEFCQKIDEIYESNMKLDTYGNRILIDSLSQMYAAAKSKLVLDSNYFGRGIFFEKSITSRNGRLLYDMYNTGDFPMDISQEYPVIMFSKVASVTNLMDSGEGKNSAFLITNKTFYYKGYISSGVLEHRTIKGSIALKDIKTFSTKKTIADILEITINGIPVVSVGIAEDMFGKEKRNIEAILALIVSLGDQLESLEVANAPVSATPSATAQTNALKDTVFHHTKMGYSLEHQTADFAQMVRKKKFSWLVFILWAIFTGPGAVIYILYYLFKSEEKMVFQLDSNGIVQGSKV